jgi:hypothetical protein
VKPSRKQTGAGRTVAISVERVEERILEIRGEKVLLDSDLAQLYQVPVKQLNQAVRRNRGRFPPDFMFQLNGEEWAALRSQSVTSKGGRGGRRYPPYAFTEHGAVRAGLCPSSEGPGHA